MSAGVVAAAPLHHSIPWHQFRNVAVVTLKMTAKLALNRPTTSNKNILPIFSTIG
jgi:hypothetical protein